MCVVVCATKLWSVLYLSLALPVKGGARSVKPARHLTVAGKALKLKRPRRVVVCAPRALKGARSESRTEESNLTLSRSSVRARASATFPCR